METAAGVNLVVQLNAFNFTSATGVLRFNPQRDRIVDVMQKPEMENNR